MKTTAWLTLAGIALALVLAITFAPAVSAQRSTGPGGPGQAQYMAGGGPGTGRRGGMGGQMGGSQQSLIAIAAQQLGMDQADLVAQLQAGKTVAQVASDKNTPLDTIVNAFVATRQPRLAQAVANGRMTQAEADARLASMRATVTARLNEPWSPQGPGMGNGDGVCDYADGGRMGRGAGR
ncbi:MAG TPA: hypothetical protein VFT99_04075 [Roseiflexaceae bacterium]|nr:hypothetical protein [Roseiflexaceae bacterium]